MRATQTQKIRCDCGLSDFEEKTLSYIREPGDKDRAGRIQGTERYQQMAKARSNATRTRKRKVYENIQIEQDHENRQTKGMSEVRVAECSTSST